MSIIEKAVKALGNRKAGERGKSDEANFGRSSDADNPNTVQRAGSSTAAQNKSDLTDLQYEQKVHADSDAARADNGVVVNIPFKKLQDQGMLTPAIPRSAVAEEYRSIKRPLLINIAGDSVTPPITNGNLIMVTSALQGDGKTFTSICLALSITMERDKHVLFVDADTAKAEAGRILGVPSNSRGLIDLLVNKDSRPEDFILPTNIEKLSILPAGSSHTHANELLASSRMRQLMLELSDEDPSRVIVFDSPPLLHTTEAAVLANFMGQIVLVVSANMTPQYAITQAIEFIGEDKTIGLVLNRAGRRINPYLNAYGYGIGPYGFGKGSPYGYGHRNRETIPE